MLQKKRWAVPALSETPAGDCHVRKRMTKIYFKSRHHNFTICMNDTKLLSYESRFRRLVFTSLWFHLWFWPYQLLTGSAGGTVLTVPVQSSCCHSLCVVVVYIKKCFSFVFALLCYCIYFVVFDMYVGSLCFLLRFFCRL